MVVRDELALLRVLSASGYGSAVSDRVSDGRRSASLDRAGVEVLASVPLFSGMSKRQLRSLAGKVKVLRYGPERTVVGEGVRGGGSMFVLLDGTAKVVRRGRTIGRLGRGDVFGELALLDTGPRSASVVTEATVETARLSRSAFLDLVRSDPDIGLRMMQVLASRLRACERGLDV